MALVSLLLDLGLAVDATDKKQNTPLHVACEHGNLEIVRALVDRGAAVDTSTALHTTPLQVACTHGQAQICHFLLACCM